MAGLAQLEAAIPSLRRYARALLRDRDAADDLVQDTLVRALPRVESVDDGRPLRPWLFTIMHNLHVSRWRRLKRRPTLVTDAVLAVAPSQAAYVDAATTLDLLGALPDEQRQVLLLVAVEGLSYAEVAALLGVPIGTVMSRLSRARDRLSVLTGRREATSAERRLGDLGAASPTGSKAASAGRPLLRRIK
jgi:RNA polymerase sigma-70 factor, ECF subfamily